jgi:hypothetical protein
MVSLQSNRVERLQFGSNPTRNMQLLLSKLEGSTIVPRPDKYYTFIYKAKTPNIRYDQHPLVQCGSVSKTGFKAYNVHWGQVRQYSWNEVLSNLYELNEEEFTSLTNVPLARFRTT